MPTFTTIALENLLEHRNSIKNSNSSTLKTPSYVSNHEEQLQQEEDEMKLKENKRLNHIYISPALYTTPEPTPILDYNSSSGSVSPSPYVFNRKGRGGGGGSGRSVNRRIDGFEVELGGDVGGGESGNCLVVAGGETENCFVDSGEVDDDDGDTFGDPSCDSMSIASLSELNDSGRLLGFEDMSVVSNQVGEFYDAIEDFSSDGSMLSCSRNLESELHTIRLALIDESGKRKIAEDDLATMCAHWQSVSKLLLPHTGQTSRVASCDSSPMRFDINEVTQFSQEVIYVRYVTEAMEKAKARADAEVAAEVIIGAKDKEISRLKDRLQYNEAMIREMSQKNLETMEVARRQRDKKRGQKKWLWSCIGLSVVIGASVIAYLYAPQHQALQNVSEIQQPEAVHD
ncbi:uncharacterized protein [Rutidosis leptorrhynchoides]|uniref:uncharacterized protein n=1 Tax=Rutidosis leptorrhynchoides TaxID=125765 RepID=UPI003A9987D8